MIKFLPANPEHEVVFVSKPGIRTKITYKSRSLVVSTKKVANRKLQAGRNARAIVKFGVPQQLVSEIICFIYDKEIAFYATGW